MSNTLPRSGSFVKDMFLDSFSKHPSSLTLQESEKMIVHAKWSEGDESLTLFVLASTSQARLKVNCVKIGQRPLIENNWPISHNLVLTALASNNNILLVDALYNDKDLQQIIANQLPVWGAEWSRRALKDRVNLASLQTSVQTPPAL